jgi:hypothetical protein
MAYFVFNLNQGVYKIAENQNDLDNLNVNKSDYKIIEDSEINFNATKYGTKLPIGYQNNEINYVDCVPSFLSKERLNSFIIYYKDKIQIFIDNNPNHPLKNKWNNYYNQLNSLNLDTLVYPTEKSLEQYFNDLGQPSLNILQLP